MSVLMSIPKLTLESMVTKRGGASEIDCRPGHVQVYSESQKVGELVKCWCHGLSQ